MSSRGESRVEMTRDITGKILEEQRRSPFSTYRSKAVVHRGSFWTVSVLCCLLTCVEAFHLPHALPSSQSRFLYSPSRYQRRSQSILPRCLMPITTSRTTGSSTAVRSVEEKTKPETTDNKTNSNDSKETKRSRWALRNGQHENHKDVHQSGPQSKHRNEEGQKSATEKDSSTALIDSDPLNWEETGKVAAMAAEDLSNFMMEINARLSNGTELLLKNLTEGMDERLDRLPDNSTSELAAYLSDLANKVQQAQQDELERQLEVIEKRFVRPLEELAFSDVPLLEAKKEISDEKVNKLAEEDQPSEKLVLMGENSTLASSRRMRTKDILRNFNVAPFYYSIALLTRWVRKASYPSLYLLSLYKTFASVIKSNTKPRKRDRSVGGDNMQAGWKRTGEIASKGPWARKWAVLRRSAEIWAYFSSFYLKDRRISAKYNSGKWSEEKFKAERSKLGAEVTQNLLKLGPVSLGGVGVIFGSPIFSYTFYLFHFCSVPQRPLSRWDSCFQRVLILFPKNTLIN